MQLVCFLSFADHRSLLDGHHDADVGNKASFKYGTVSCLLVYYLFLGIHGSDFSIGDLVIELHRIPKIFMHRDFSARSHCTLFSITYSERATMTSL